MSGRVLVVDDEPSMRFLERVMLEPLGIAVEEADTGEAALRILESDPGFDLVVLDYRMPGLTGLEVARDLRAGGNRTPIILYSGFLAEALAGEVESLDLRFVDKSDPDELVSAVQDLVPGGR
jgi:CheY-like chemotaxis protein